MDKIQAFFEFFGVKYKTVVGEIAGLAAIIAGIVLALLCLAVFLIYCSSAVSKRPVDTKKLRKNFGPPILIAVAVFIVALIVLYADNNLRLPL